MLWHLRRVTSWVSGSALAPYFSHRRQHLQDLGYLIVEYVDQGKMLSESWDQYRHDNNQRTNLFRDLSRMMLCLAKVPLPRIGSWTIDDRGLLALRNRPLTCLLHELENAQIPTNMPRNLTYTSTEPYLLDLIACHDVRLRCQPNSIHDKSDGEAQLAGLTAMRALLTKFTDRRLREGPFVLSLTDLHQSNIFVDGDWHITRVIDLEWACARPIEMLSPPSWLSNRSLEELGFHLEEYARLHEEFLDVFNDEELTCSKSDSCSRLIENCWKTGAFWYLQALDNPSALLAVFIDHIQPLFAKLSTAAVKEFNRVLTPYWDRDTSQFISSKVVEQDQYSDRVREIFATAALCDKHDEDDQ